MYIFIKTITGSTLGIETDLTQTVHDIKLQIQEKYGHAVHTQRLILCGCVMDDNKTLGFYEVHKQTVVHIVLIKTPISEPQTSDTDLPRKRICIEKDE